MAHNEDSLWEILILLYRYKSGWMSKIGEQIQSTDFENGPRVSALKSKLVLNFLPEDIEETIYFMKHRKYLNVHGQGTIMPEAVYSLTEKAISVYENKKRPEEEIRAFKESLWNIEPKLYAMGPNIKGWKKL